MSKIRLESQDGLKQQIHILKSDGSPALSSVDDKEFVLFADEPTALGGGGTAPAPYDYLLTALSACTAITLRMYADRKGIALKHITVDLEHKKSEKPDGTKFDLIKKEIQVQGELSDEQIERLKEIADKCPVNRTLQNAATIETKVTRI
jgi:putative redox protein